MARRGHYRETTDSADCGPQLDVEITFKGTDSNGNACDDKWISVTRLSEYLKDTARRIEKTLYGEPVQASRPAGRRISPRLEVIYELEETETEDRLQQRWTEYACAAAATAAGQ